MMARNRRFGGWLVPTAIVPVPAGVLDSGAITWSAFNGAFSGTMVQASDSWSAGAGQTTVFRFTVPVVHNNPANGLDCRSPLTWDAHA
jgi:hypothetical protein